MSHAEFEVCGTWNGESLVAGERAHFDLKLDRSSGKLEISVDAAYYGDPPPEVPPGSVDGLWNFEVVEVFLVAMDGRYLEIELGPHGHYLGLLLSGRRVVVERELPLEFDARRIEASWQGTATIDLDWLPMPVRAGNAYAMHGAGEERRYLAAQPVPGEFPDFHRLECFTPVTLE